MKKETPAKREIKGSQLNKVNARGEGGTLLCYFRSLGMIKDSDTLILYSNNHFFYDKTEIARISALLNLRQLNHFSHPARFIAQLAGLMTEGSCFSGYFKALDNNGRNGKNLFSIVTDIFSRVLNPLKSGRKGLDKNRFIKLMESNGFYLKDISEINGLTYFCSVKKSSRSESGLSREYS